MATKEEWKKYKATLDLYEKLKPLCDGSHFCGDIDIYLDDLVSDIRTEIICFRQKLQKREEFISIASRFYWDIEQKIDRYCSFAGVWKPDISREGAGRYRVRSKDRNFLIAADKHWMSLSNVWGALNLHKGGDSTMYTYKLITKCEIVSDEKIKTYKCSLKDFNKAGKTPQKIWIATLEGIYSHSTVSEANSVRNLQKRVGTYVRGKLSG